MQIKDTDKVERVFDLKGSTVDRRTKLSSYLSTSKLKTLKDENFLELSERAEHDLVVMFESDRAFVR